MFRLRCAMISGVDLLGLWFRSVLGKWCKLRYYSWFIGLVLCEVRAVVMVFFSVLGHDV